MPLCVFAWAFLRRNPTYSATWSTLTATALAEHWGLRTQWSPSRDDAPPRSAWCVGRSAEHCALVDALRNLLPLGAETGARNRALAEQSAQIVEGERREAERRFGRFRNRGGTRFVRALQAWDGRVAGASDSAIARVLFPDDAELRSARARARHVLGEAQRFIDARYLQLALLDSGKVKTAQGMHDQRHDRID